MEADDRQSNFDYATGQVLVANQDGNSRGLIDVDKFDFAPRLGFAWSPFKDGKTAFRGGYGIFYGAQEVRTGFQLGYSMPFFFALSKSSEFGVTPAAYVSEGFPALDPTAASFPGILSADRRFKSPYYQQWNVSVQRDIGWNTLLEVAYSRVAREPTCRSCAITTSRSPGPGDPQERRPYPAVRQLRVDHQRGHLDLQLPPAQTQQAVEQRHLAAHCIHLWQGVQRISRRSAARRRGLQTATTSAASTAPPITTSAIAPSRASRGICRSAWGAVSSTRAAWSTGSSAAGSSVGSRRSPPGFPFSPAISLDTSNTGTFGQLRPDLTGNPNVSDPSPARWYNPEAYSTPAEFTFGNAGRNSLVGPGTRTADLYMRKDFKLGDRARLEFRIEAFNVFNHPNFGLPDNYVDDGESAGTITYTSLSQRQIQIGARLGF